MVLYGRSAARPAGAPLDLIDQVGPRRQQRKLEVNLKATIARPDGPSFRRRFRLHCSTRSAMLAREMCRVW